MVHVFDTESFIELVRERPALWDLTSEDYSNKQFKQRCWYEVFCQMVDNFASLDDEVKETKSAEILRRWKSLRNSFTRELAKQRSGEGASKRKTYVYFDMLSFIKPSIINSTAEESQEEDIAKEISQLKDRTRKRKSNSVPKETLKEPRNLRLKKDGEDDDDKLFLLSLHTHLKAVPEDRKLFAKSELLQVLAKHSHLSSANRSQFQ